MKTQEDIQKEYIKKQRQERIKMNFVILLISVVCYCFFVFLLVGVGFILDGDFAIIKAARFAGAFWFAFFILYIVYRLYDYLNNKYN